MIGKNLYSHLQKAGHTVRRIVRGIPQSSGDIAWNADTGDADTAALDGVDVVIHLAGEGISNQRWTPKVKQRIRTGRVQGTLGLCEAMARCQNKPKALICASAIGFYGNRGDTALTESSPAGAGFLADVCREWEAACKPARDEGIRVINLRFGMVLTPTGGALKKMLLPFKLGLGGLVGNGRQFMSWVSLADVLGIIEFALITPALCGPVNAVAPGSVTNHDFTKALGQALHRPTFFPLPAFLARLMFGEMADELLLASTRVVPQALMQAGYGFKDPDLATFFASAAPSWTR